MSDDAKKLDELVGDLRTAMLTTRDLRARPMTVQRIDADATTWMLVDRRADWISGDPGPVGVTWADDDVWVAAVGTATVVEDRAVIDELCDRMTESFFDDDASPAALRIDVEHADWWNSPGMLTQGVKVLVGLVRGEQGDLGDRGSIEA